MHNYKNKIQGESNSEISGNKSYELKRKKTRKKMSKISKECWNKFFLNV